MKSRALRILSTDLPIGIILIFALFPWAWMVLCSFRPESELTQSPLTLIPHTFTLANHIALLRETSFTGNLRDSLVIATGAVVLGLVLSIPAAYAFSRFRFRFRQVLRVQFLAINMFPVVMLILPLFILLRQLQPARHLHRADRRPRHLHPALRHLAAHQLHRRYPARA